MGGKHFFHINMTPNSAWVDCSLILFGRHGICTYLLAGSSENGKFSRVSRNILAIRYNITEENLYPISLSEDGTTATINVHTTNDDYIRILGSASHEYPFGVIFTRVNDDEE